MAAHGFVTRLFSACAEQIVAEVSAHPGHELSLENVMVAEVDGRVVGSWAGGMDGEVPSALIIRVAGWRAARAAMFAIVDTSPVQRLPGVPRVHRLAEAREVLRRVVAGFLTSSQFMTSV